MPPPVAIPTATRLIGEEVEIFGRHEAAHGARPVDAGASSWVGERAFEIEVYLRVLKGVAGSTFAVESDEPGLKAGTVNGGSFRKRVDLFDGEFRYLEESTVGLQPPMGVACLRPEWRCR